MVNLSSQANFGLELWQRDSTFCPESGAGFAGTTGAPSTGALRVIPKKLFRSFLFIWWLGFRVSPARRFTWAAGMVGVCFVVHWTSIESGAFRFACYSISMMHTWVPSFQGLVYSTWQIGILLFCWNVRPTFVGPYVRSRGYTIKACKAAYTPQSKPQTRSR